MHNTEDEEKRDANIRARNGGLDPRRQGKSPILDELQNGTHPDAREGRQHIPVNTYNGVCVGGPMDGKLLAHRGTKFTATENLSTRPLSPGPEPMPGMMPLQEHIYYWEGTGTWRHGHLSIPQMIYKMAEVYAAEAARRDDGK